MNQFKQIRFSDREIAENRKVTRTEKKLRKKEEKQTAGASGIYYGVLDKGKRNHPLGDNQKRGNKQKSKVR